MKVEQLTSIKAGEMDSLGVQLIDYVTRLYKANKTQGNECTLSHM